MMQKQQRDRPELSAYHFPARKPRNESPTKRHAPFYATYHTDIYDHDKLLMCMPSATDIFHITAAAYFDGSVSTGRPKHTLISALSFWAFRLPSFYFASTFHYRAEDIIFILRLSLFISCQYWFWQETDKMQNTTRNLSIFYIYYFAKSMFPQAIITYQYYSHYYFADINIIYI